MSIPKTYPLDEEAPLLDWWGGFYDAAFVALHPFQNFATAEPHAAAILRREKIPAPPGASAVDTLFVRIGIGANEPEVDALFEQILDLEKQHAVPVRWESVRQGTDLRDVGELNHGLLTSIGALRSEFENNAAAERIQAYCQRTQLREPDEGQFQPLMQTSLAELFARAGITQIEARDEFEEDVKLIALAELQTAHAWRGPRIPFRGTLCAKDQSLLIAQHWDSFFTLICGERAQLEACGVEQLFEGFWATPSTRHDWWRPIG